jgi:hypothetical protein
MERCADCGLPIYQSDGSYYERVSGDCMGLTYHSHCGDHFGVKAAVAKARAAEREACAQIADDNQSNRVARLIRERV